MFRAALDWAMKQVEVAPDYSATDCLSAHGTACNLCADACPHQAITVSRTVKIDPVDCTGCGLCVAACPSHALSPSGRKVAFPNPLRCSKVQGDGASITCLAKLQASEMAQMAGLDEAQTVRLAHGDCANCPIGSAEVPQVVAATAAKAKALRLVGGAELHLELQQTERLEAQPDRRTIGRRELLRGGWSQLRHAGSEAMAPLDRALERVTGRVAGDEAPRAFGSSAKAPRIKPAERAELPAEHVGRLRTIAQAEPAPQQLVPWALPEVLDGCILCPACTRACPSDAIRRVFDGDGSGGARLELEAARCTGCTACVQACPVGVVVMRDPVPWSDVIGPTRLLHQAGPPTGADGSVSRSG